MKPGTAERALRTVLLGTGCIAAATGGAVALRGSRAIPGGAPVNASVDSVLRFYAVMWATQASVTIPLARRPTIDDSTLTAVSASTFAGGVARLLAMRQSGLPHPLFGTLAALELLTPAAVAALRASMEQRPVGHAGG
jgi:hypothetical protein